MTKYYTYVANGSVPADELWEVEKPSKNNNGYWDTKKKNLAVSHLIVPYYCTDKNGKYIVDKNAEKNETGYSVRQCVSVDYLLGYSKEKNVLPALKSYVNSDFDTAEDLNILEVDLKNNKLLRKNHKKGSWSVTIQRTYSVLKVTRGKYNIDRIQGDNVGTISTKVSFTQSAKSIPMDIVLATAHTSEKYASNDASTYTVGNKFYFDHEIDKSKLNSNYSSFDIDWLSEYKYVYTLQECIFVIDLDFSNKITIADKDWILGSVSDGSSNGPIGSGRYCFYSTVGYGKNRMYFANSLPVGPSGVTNCNCVKQHGGSTVNTSPSKTGTTNGSNQSLVYSSGNVSLSNYGKVGRFELGKTGVYEDGKATVPYVMIELRGAMEDTKGYSLSIPANNDSFISLTHERNLYDSYNTFSLQLFDKDAMEVEEKLLLGFRYIVFWYTDFVSSSKRFKGEVLDYTTVITGKGLMLTLTGYTADTNIYTGKDSIPWSKFFEARDYSFFYWLNDVGEYQGEVRVVQWDEEEHKAIAIDDGIIRSWTDYDTNESYKYNSNEGYLIPALVLKLNNSKMYNWMVNSKNYKDKKSDFDTRRCNYSLKGPSDKDPNVETWNTFDKYYNGKVVDKVLNEHRPYPVEWSLEQYNSNLLNNLSMWGNQLDLLSEKRPSSVIKLICAINGWVTRDEYIVKTKKVSEIPDQISMSFTQYIKEKLIPISMSDDEYNSTQYSFFFDDNGYVHYEPIRKVTASKSIYFNSPKIKDTYPLIAFTAATNGNVLMQVNKAQTMEAINVITGDEIDVTAYTYTVDGREISPSTYKTEEWFETNRFTKERNRSNLVNKGSIVSFSNVSAVPSEDDLKKALINRYGEISRYTYKANIDVYGCADLYAGQMINVYIYLDDGARSFDPVSSEYVSGQKTVTSEAIEVDDVNHVERKVMISTKEDVKGYKGNITLHHSSGTYFINKITDTVSGGRYVSSLQVLKIDVGSLNTILEQQEKNDELPRIYKSSEEEDVVTETKEETYCSYNPNTQSPAINPYK